MDNSVMESLLELGYETNEDVIGAGIENKAFRDLVAALTNEIHVLGETEETISGTEDLAVFCIELSSLLTELNCPFTIGTASDSYMPGSLQVLDFLATELMALQMNHANDPTNKHTGSTIELQRTPTASALRRITEALGLPDHQQVPTLPELFQPILQRTEHVLKTVGGNRIGKPLLSVSNSFTEDQWASLYERHSELDAEYDLRREMLLTRLDCTVQAFNWGERTKKLQDQIFKVYQAKLAVLQRLVNGGTNTDISAMLAARDLLLAIEKTSSAAVVKNTKSKIQRHIIGSVPDRGGRAWEHAPPAPEMPSWQKQRAQGDASRGRGGGGHRGGWQGNHPRTGGGQRQDNPNQNYNSNAGGGRRVQGGWSQRGAQSGGHRGRGGYNNRRNNMD